MSSSPNISDPNHDISPSKQYKKVVFQQGKPILDVDLNDISATLEAQHLSLLVEKMGYAPPQLNYREWALVPLDNIPHNSKNEDNFGITLGRLDTFKGVVDTSHMMTLGNNSAIPFDASKEPLSYGSWQNYILKGTVTSLDSGNTALFTDDTKSFQAGHRLTGYTHTLNITPNYKSTYKYTADTSENTSTIDDCRIILEESSCRVVFVANNQIRGGSAISIAAFSGDSLELAAPLPGVQVGDEYYILPPNSLTEYRNSYDATTSQQDSKSEGLNGLPQLVTYVQVFEEDISSSEDSDIQSTVLGTETTRRTQLRWCIRVAKLKTSSSSLDTNDSLSSLTLSHVFEQLSGGKYVEHQVLLDSTDETASDNTGYLKSTFWKQSTTTNSFTERYSSISEQDSPYTDSLGLSPLHFFNSVEAKLDRIYWSFLKSIFVSTSGSDFNDFVILNIFNSESKTEDETIPAVETLSQYFYPALTTDPTTSPVDHAWLSVGSAFQAKTGDETATPAFFKAPPRVFHTQADLSTDNLQSRTLFGLRGGILYGDSAPLVFESVSSHFSFIDQALLGLTGLGSSQGLTRDDLRIPAAIDYTLDGTTTGLSQAGYGAGAIKQINPLATNQEVPGFLSGTSTTPTYLLREKGSRANHTVNIDDPDLGWSFYKNEQTNNATTTGSDFSVRGWDEGPAQAVAFLRGLNFRKLAIKTTAHKSQDLFTISQKPPRTNNEIGSTISHKASSTSFLAPTSQNLALNGNLFIDSYSGSSQSRDVSVNPSFNATNFYPSQAQPSRFVVKSLLDSYRSDISGVTNYNINPENYNQTLGAWNRFDVSLIETFMPNDSDNTSFVNDLWSNRCTAMRLRYHVGDFYPGEVDDSGFRKNLLVDSMNLFLKVEPLSLTHWMTMPKHQHTILESSLSMADGIEALLKVAHGLGDTQKLINAAGNPLINANSPARTELPTATPNIGDLDPLDLPFGHADHPFVHWYHPAMHKIRSPQPSSADGSVYTNSVTQTNYTVTVYPKWGRRSLIVPALVPSIFGEKTLHGNNEHQESVGHLGTDDVVVPYIRERDADPEGNYTDANITNTADIDATFTIDLDPVSDSTAVEKAVLPYFYHGSKSTDGSSTITTDNVSTFEYRHNQITFPAIGTITDNIAPSPVFVPASRIYVRQDGSNDDVQLGFNTYINEFSTSYWNDVDSSESKFPYDEIINYYAQESGSLGELPPELRVDFPAWSVPVMRASIRTRTVASIVNLVRTSFETGLDDSTLSSDYDFTMPSALVNLSNEYFNSYTYTHNRVPAVGPDVPVDTLFVGDLGTALGGFTNRSGFLSPLNLGVPMRVLVGGMPNGMVDTEGNVRDSFELALYEMDSGNNLINTFTAINNMGLQQKLMWNCSFRVLHSRPAGTGTTSSTPPKSLTEMFLVKDRVNNQIVPLGISPENAKRKPFIHLMSMHPRTSSSYANKAKLSHLYPLVSDSTGGAHSNTALLESGGLEKRTYDYTELQVRTSSMGDTYATDPFDYELNSALLPTGNPIRERELLESNSGIEVDLLSELNAIHEDVGSYGLDTTATIDSIEPAVTLSTDLRFIDMMPTANELTQPGDHELIFVLYTGHYGAQMHDTSENSTNIDHIPPVAGCHLTATLEINRPSDRHDSDSTGANNKHYGEVITTYSIPSTKE